MTYDPNEWLVSLHRELPDYVRSAFEDDLVTVEMGYPNTDKFTKETPLDKILIHFEQDDEDEPVLGFGTPGVEEYDEDQGVVALIEAQHHLVNFDVGVWVSAQCGGATGRMQTVQALKNLFGVAGAKVRMRDTTGGLYPRSFVGGRFVLDRVNDLPIWRASQMTLIVECFSRHAPEVLVPAVLSNVELEDHMTIDGDPVITP